MADIIKITSSLLQRIFSNIKRELNKKANSDEVVLIDYIGQPDWVAPLDSIGRVPRENLPVMGAIQEFRMGVASTLNESSTIKWDYIVFDKSRQRFVAYKAGEYYGNWTDSADYVDKSTFKPRADRLFVDNENSKFYRWNGNSLVECCQPLGETSTTAYAGDKGKALADQVTTDEELILKAAFLSKSIPVFTKKTDAQNNLKNLNDVCYVTSDGKYYRKQVSGLMEVTLSSLNNYGYGVLQSIFSPFADLTSNKTYTPFKDSTGNLKTIIKGETIGGLTRWLLIMNDDGEDQTYTAGTSSNARYYNQSFTHKSGMFNKPWELWLPYNVDNQSVLIQF